jgi:class 3 adenylate cyclase
MAISNVMDRKLVAILAADVVGYSALMERDEKGTFVRLKSHRTELFEPEIKKRHGRVGDGLLAEFASVVDAVECAVTVQQEMAKCRSAWGLCADRHDKPLKSQRRVGSHCDPVHILMFAHLMPIGCMEIPLHSKNVLA